MKYSRLLIISLFLLKALLGFSQQILANKDSLIKIIKEPDIQNTATQESEWYASNDDSAFFKSDTLVFYNFEGYKHSCHYIVWKFDSALSIFGQEKFNLCIEPPASTTDYYPMKLSITKKEAEEVLVLFLGKNIRQRYKILSLTPIKIQFASAGPLSTIYQLKLLRLKN